MEYKNWAPWHPLKTVMLGRCYEPSFYESVANPKIKSALLRITEETMEDLANYEKVLKEFGCKVIRPDLDPTDNILNHGYKTDGKVRIVGTAQGIPRAPLQPRDAQVVIGKKLYYCFNDHKGIKSALSKYNPKAVSIGETTDEERASRTSRTTLSKFHFEQLAGHDWGTYDDYLQPGYLDTLKPHIRAEVEMFQYKLAPLAAASIIPVGKDVYVDNVGNSFMPSNEAALRKNLTKGTRLNKISFGGHADGCMHLVKPGALLSIIEMTDYDRTFPGWDVCYLPHMGWNQMQGFLKMKDKVSGKWWVPGEEDNDEFTSFVETWLNDWVGFAEESVFDVNTLSLDDSHIVVNNYHKEAFEFFKKHKVEPIIVPFRHRYFWDGGLHCITLDLYREGVQEDYFPNRKIELDI